MSWSYCRVDPVISVSMHPLAEILSHILGFGKAGSDVVHGPQSGYVWHVFCPGKANCQRRVVYVPFCLTASVSMYTSYPPGDCGRLDDFPMHPFGPLTKDNTRNRQASQLPQFLVSGPCAF